MNAAGLPEMFAFNTSAGRVVVRAFKAEAASEFPRLTQAARRAIPSAVRRLFKAAAGVAEADAQCVICEAAAPVDGRVLIAIGDDFGAICANCWSLGDDGREAV
jgi:hypothetical protein